MKNCFTAIVATVLLTTPSVPAGAAVISIGPSRLSRSGDWISAFSIRDTVSLRTFKGTTYISDNCVMASFLAKNTGASGFDRDPKASSMRENTFEPALIPPQFVKNPFFPEIVPNERKMMP